MQITEVISDSERLDKPGAYLARIRIEKGYDLDYVAGKLHLRANIIKLLESDDYNHMPEPVFIKGYLRAYAKLMDIPSEPLLTLFNRIYLPERKVEKALWQSKRRRKHHVEHIVQWVTGLVVVGVLIAVVVWWQNNKDNEQLFTTHAVEEDASAQNTSDTDIRLTDLSKMRSLLSSNDMENNGG